MKKRLYLIEGFALALYILLLSSCSASSGHIAYSDRELAEALQDALYHGQTQIVRSYASDSVSQEQLNADLAVLLQEDYLADCLLTDGSAELKDSGSEAEILLRLTYAKQAQFTGTIHEASDEKSLQVAMADMMNHRARRTPILLQDCSFSEDAIFGFLNEAEINCAEAPCGAEKVSYAAFEPGEKEQLILVWGEYPAAEARLKEVEKELKEAVSQAEKELFASQLFQNRDRYESIYDFICSRTHYDENLASLMQVSPSRVTPDMHIQRSAYGSLVSGSTVCTGYARGFKALCDAADLPCYVISGTKDGVSHAWNAVQVHEETFYIDCTAGDTGTPKDEAFLFSPDTAQEKGYDESGSCHIPWE